MRLTQLHAKIAIVMSLIRNEGIWYTYSLTNRVHTEGKKKGEGIKKRRKKDLTDADSSLRDIYGSSFADRKSVV